ncbi:MAG: aldo/keto reductase [Rhodospirillaceae bacterium]|nr:aldo/keto reductase [Rhodospirillaceae bacterium]
MNVLSRIGLGSAQWGAKYGITNATGRPTDTTISSMLKVATSAGIDLIDTAQAYGDAEQTIGRLLPSHPGFHIVTKISPKSGQPTNNVTDETSAVIRRSIENMNDQRPYGILLHNTSELLGPDGPPLWTSLCEQRDSGCVQKIGISVYSPEELDAVLSDFSPDLVQLPYNVYDQRFARSGLLDTLRSRRIEVHARSAFLQGLLLLPVENLPPYFSDLTPHHKRYTDHIASLGLTPVQAALIFCLKDLRIDRVIVGCETLPQLQDIISSVESLRDEYTWNFDIFNIDDLRFILPTLWKH